MKVRTVIPMRRTERLPGTAGSLSAAGIESIETLISLSQTKLQAVNWDMKISSGRGVLTGAQSLLSRAYRQAGRNQRIRSRVLFRLRDTYLNSEEGRPDE